MASGTEIRLSPGAMQITRAPALPLAGLVVGKPVREVAALLPRLFNLCRMAQGAAARAALGLPPETTTADLAAEVLRDHLAALFVTLPPLLGLAPARPPQSAIAQALFGMGGLPRNLPDLNLWLASGAGVSPLAQAVSRAFPGRMASAPALPAPNDPLADGPYDTSLAARRAGHPLLTALESERGRSPLWRLMVRLVDAEACLRGDLPAVTVANGTALAPAARGTYALRLTHAGGLVTTITRRTPTDHLLAPGGMLHHSLMGSPPALAPLVIALHDPCEPVTLREVRHA
ncbi:hypothetical protein [Fuscibacter oryzae]|uniref:Hydrogenase expression/formation protein HupK n=1 Tax=Fuscibacter oryzae TaxID=2803939 RepID=A0A8J7STJ8_9RHOB|nr:hypothetical protein [Fuscibacter oryzae]MBL4929271.1 hypothetical protein [Fuscibacter oryzae]